MNRIINKKWYHLHLKNKGERFSLLVIHFLGSLGVDSRFGGSKWCFWNFLYLKYITFNFKMHYLYVKCITFTWNTLPFTISSISKLNWPTQFSFLNMKPKKGHGKVLTYIHICKKLLHKAITFWGGCQCDHSKIIQRWAKILNDTYYRVLPKYIHVWEGRWGRWNMYLMSTF